MLLASGKRCDLHSQRADILLITDNHLCNLNGGVHAVVIGASVVTGGIANGTVLCFSGQVSGCVADDTRLFLAFLQHALPEAAHGHDADFILENTGGRFDFELGFCRADSRPGSRAHGGDHTGAACIDFFTIQVSTPLGKTRTTHVYVFRDDETNGASAYFADVPVTGHRVFRDGSLPTFDQRTTIQLLGTSDQIPPLTGILTNLSTGEETVFDGSSRAKKTINLTPGTFHADLYSGYTESGSVYHYELNFNIIAEDSKPYVNYRNLFSTDRLSDLSSKYYQVAWDAVLWLYDQGDLSAIISDDTQVQINTVSRTDYYVYENESMYKYDIDRLWLGDMPRVEGSFRGNGETRISLYPGEYLSLRYNGAEVARVGNVSDRSSGYTVPTGTTIPKGNYTIGEEIPAGT